MTVPEAAEALEVSVGLVYRLCRAGRLGHSRVGMGRGVIRISREDVDRYRSEREVIGCAMPEAEVPARPRRVRGVVVPDMLGPIWAEEDAREARRKAKAK